MLHFWRPHRELTIAEIVELTKAVVPGGPPERRIRNIAPLDTAGAADISFLEQDKDLAELAGTQAGACLLPAAFAALAPPGVVVLTTDTPYRAFVLVARALFPAALRPLSLFEESGRAAGAVVHPSARIEAGVTIDPLAVVGPRAQIGAGTVIASGAVIGAEVCIGRQCAIGSGATIQYALIGDRVTVHAGARIGQDGGTDLVDPQGALKIPRIGRVIIQDGVEIGANSAIDRGSIRDTVIGEGSKIDNLVQIAHNVRIGRCCLMVAQSGISADTTVEDFAVIERSAAPGARHERRDG